MNRLSLWPIVCSVRQQGVLLDTKRSQQGADAADLGVHRRERTVIVGLIFVKLARILASVRIRRNIGNVHGVIPDDRQERFVLSERSIDELFKTVYEKLVVVVI
jgi:hypothetical protein